MPSDPTPGPIGALAWQRAAVKAALTFMGKEKVDLGVAGYGYIWRANSVETLSDARARALAGTRARYDDASGEWTAHLGDGSTIWWSDARSYRARVDLATSLGLHGLAVWSLGLSDPLS